MKRPGRKILYVVTEDWYFCSHRVELAKAARSAGYQMAVAARFSTHRDQLQQEGFDLYDVPFYRSAGRPWRDLHVLFHLIWLYRKYQPDIVHHVAMKPCLLGSLAALFTRNIRVVNAVTGLGYIFTGDGWRQRSLRALLLPVLRVLFNNQKTWIIVQNADDLRYLNGIGLITLARSRLIRGSGVNPDIYNITDEPASDTPLIVLPARMLADKGVFDFVAAAGILKQQDCKVRCILVGPVDHGNPTAVSEGQLRAWESECVIEWRGFQQDMINVYQESHIVCLPSYREGLPRVLLEAAACGRAIVTTDVPGCREIVEHEVNGLLVPAGDPQALAAALRRLVEDRDLRRQLGVNGRQRVITGFSLKQVNCETLSLYQEVLADADT